MTFLCICICWRPMSFFVHFSFRLIMTSSNSFKTFETTNLHFFPWNWDCLFLIMYCQCKYWITTFNFVGKIVKTLVKICGEPINCIAIFLTLQDFRNFTYSLPIIRGMMIHMEDKLTTVLIPQNSYPQIQKALEMSNTPVLALGGNFRLVF